MFPAVATGSSWRQMTRSKLRMNWTNALGLCPRCEASVDDAQKVCVRCGLRLVAPEFLTAKLAPELNTKILKPLEVSRRVESRLPAVLVMCAVAVLAVGIVLASAGRNGDSAQATSPGATATVAYRAPDLIRAYASPTSSKRFASRPAPTATRTSDPQPIDSPELRPPPPATQAPADTPVPPAPEPQAVEPQAIEPMKVLPGVGNYASNLNGWMVKLDGIGSRPVLWSPAPDTMHQAQGTFWMAYVVYRNDTDKPRSLAATLNFALQGSDGQLYDEYSNHGNDPQRTKIPLLLEANPFDFIVSPGQRTATVLVFDFPAGVEPAQLVAHIHDEDSALPDGQVAWNLTKAP